MINDTDQKIAILSRQFRTAEDDLNREMAVVHLQAPDGIYQRGAAILWQHAGMVEALRAVLKLHDGGGEHPDDTRILAAARVELNRATNEGLPIGHHCPLTFRSDHCGVDSDVLAALPEGIECGKTFQECRDVFLNAARYAGSGPHLPRRS